MGNDFLDAAKKVKKLKSDIENDVSDGVDTGMEDVKDEAKANVDDNDSYVSGGLKEGIKRRQRITSEYMYTSEVVSKAPYSGYVEYGSGLRGDGRYGPHSSPPPFEDILAWVVEKGIQPIYVDSQYALADAIQRTIYEKGTFAHPFWRNAWHARKGRVVREGKRGMHRAVRKF